MNIKLDANRAGIKYDTYWKKLITAGRAAEGLREDFRQQMREMQSEIGFEYIRFHGIYHSDMMICNMQPNGVIYYNWQYFDNLFDFFKEVKLKPILELGFTPECLKSGDHTQFWWKANVTPPKDYEKWAKLISDTVIHCINRYGIDEVLTWYFEVWNEPNLYMGFWTGDMAEYFKLYKYTVDAIKRVDNRLRVGGPATSNSCNGKAPWLIDFLQHCQLNDLPVDFVSTHPYPNNWPFDNYGNQLMEYRGEDSTYLDILSIIEDIENTKYKGCEIHLTEWNSSPSPRDLFHDTAFMAPFLINNYIKCIGKVNSLGYWAFSDVFEEGAAGKEIFHGGFGIINAQGIKKSGYFGFWFLARLGDEILDISDRYIVTKKGENIQILCWNYCHYNEKIAKGDRSELTQLNRYSCFEDSGNLDFELDITLVEGDYKVTEFLLDRENGSAYDFWLKNGAIKSPSEEEISIIKRNAFPTVNISVNSNVDRYKGSFSLQPHGVKLIEIQKKYRQL